MLLEHPDLVEGGPHQIPDITTPPPPPGSRSGRRRRGWSSSQAGGGGGGRGAHHRLLGQHSLKTKIYVYPPYIYYTIYEVCDMVCLIVADFKMSLLSSACTEILSILFFSGLYIFLSNPSCLIGMPLNRKRKPRSQYVCGRKRYDCMNCCA